MPRKKAVKSTHKKRSTRAAKKDDATELEPEEVQDRDNFADILYLPKIEKYHLKDTA